MNFMGTADMRFLQVECHSSHPTNSVGSLTGFGEIKPDDILSYFNTCYQNYKRKYDWQTYVQNSQRCASVC